MILRLSGLALILVNIVHAQPSNCPGIFPENNLWISDAAKSYGVSEADFNDVIDKVINEYGGEIKSKYGAELVFNRLWKKGTVNSDTYTDGNKWIVNSYGGLARYPGMTKDAYAVVACHELGHHLGGAPLFSDDPDEWASVEGEADYFASLKCLRRIFEKEDSEALLANADRFVIRKCRKNHPRSRLDQAVCARAAQASLVLILVFRDIDGGKFISFATPDRRRVKHTYKDHPAAQCRLDTYFHGALCGANPYQELDQKDYHVNSCSDQIREKDGVRPRCWFRPS